MAYDTTIVNAAPMTKYDGFKDVSERQLPPPVPNLAQHQPLFIISAEKGPIGKSEIDPSKVDVKRFLGVDTFDIDGKHYNHQTKGLEIALAAGNICHVVRVRAPDAKAEANVTLYLDVLETDVPLYEKEADGSVKYDKTGKPVAVKDTNGTSDKTVKGFSVMWVAEGTENAVGEYAIGSSKVRAGIQTGTGGNSKQYPIAEFAYKDVSTAGNNLGISITALTQRDRGQFPGSVLTQGNIYPYVFSLKSIVDDVTGETKPVLSKQGSEAQLFSFAKGAKDPRTKRVLDLGIVVEDNYIDIPEHQRSGLGDVFIYHNNYEELVKKFYEAESKVTDSHSDPEIRKDATNYNAINIVSFVNSSNSPYQAVKLVDMVGSVRLTRSNTVFLEHGDSGTVTNDFYEKFVQSYLEEYANPLSPLSSHEASPETDFYDTGFKLETKLAIPYFISLRKDTFAVLTTHIHGEVLSLEDQTALAASMDSAIRLTPESTVHSTGTCRAMVLAGTGVLTGDDYRERGSIVYDHIRKTALYMGANSGEWVTNRLFDRVPGSIIGSMSKVDIDWVPASTRNELWDLGLNFPLKYTNAGNSFMPALKTVCKSDTSVLTSFFTVKACCNLVRVGFDAWKQLSGNISLTDDQLIERNNRYIIERTHNAFDGIYRVVPETVITEFDAIRGYSWTTIIKLYSNNMKTVQQLVIESHRFSDL